MLSRTASLSQQDLDHNGHGDGDDRADGGRELQRVSERVAPPSVAFATSAASEGTPIGTPVAIMPRYTATPMLPRHREVQHRQVHGVEQAGQGDHAEPDP